MSKVPCWPLVLRCDDCITCHSIQCYDAGVSSAELEEALGMVGGPRPVPAST